MVGHIKIDRKILNWEWYSDQKVFHFFLYLLLKANYKDGTHRSVEIKRGQLLTGRLKISKETGLTEREIRTVKTKLIETGEITVKTTNKYSIITICKYDTYQKGNYQSDSQNDQQNVSQTTNKTTTNNNTIINKEDNTTTAVVEMGIVLVKEIANEVWKDKKWIDELCIGCGLTLTGAKDWMRQFNLSISQDTITGFDAKRYKKMFQGWLRVKLGGGQKVTKLKDSDAEVNKMLKEHGL